MAYPVSTAVEPQLTNRNRLTTAFRIILAIPHLILVGGLGASIVIRNGGSDTTSFGGETGLLGTIAVLLAIYSWFTIVFARDHNATIRRYTRFYLRWRVRGLAYVMLLADPYPPFDDGPYPVSFTFTDPEKPRDIVTVVFRLFLAIPHFIVLFFLGCAWWVTTVIAWFVILFTAQYPRGLYDFGTGVLRWLIRVEAYMLLMIDDYPPFSFS